MRLLLDTSVLIDVLRSRNRRRELLADLARAGHDLSTSALNIAEVYTGMLPSEREETTAFLGALDCYELSRSAGQLAGSLKSHWGKKGRTIALADTIVAAIALQNDCVLVTDNGKDFPMPELQLYPLPD